MVNSTGATTELNVPPGDEWASERYKESKEVTAGLARWGMAGAKAQGRGAGSVCGTSAPH